jgi:hypothetical protein
MAILGAKHPARCSAPYPSASIAPPVLDRPTKGATLAVAAWSTKAPPVAGELMWVPIAAQAHAMRRAAHG